jgi:hypothetical protein
MTRCRASTGIMQVPPGQYLDLNHDALCDVFAACSGVHLGEQKG